jgi:hypothetical protein
MNEEERRDAEAAAKFPIGTRVTCPQWSSAADKDDEGIVIATGQIPSPLVKVKWTTKSGPLAEANWISARYLDRLDQ